MRKPIGLALVLLMATSASELHAQQSRLSPRDSVAVSVDDREISVAWGSPSIRGRPIFGGLVPWGEVWRTGANEATALRTEADLVVGGQPVPAGSYTLYTIPEPDGWTLIINRETEQWGTRYDSSLDLARVPMRVEAIADPVERFTILLASELSGSLVEVENARLRVGRIALIMEWERTRAAVALELAPSETVKED